MSHGIIRQAIVKATRDNTMVGLLFFNLDRFKLINDSPNYSFEDKLLQIVAKRIKFSIRQEDILVHLGDDKFVVIVTSIKDEDCLHQVATNLLNIFHHPFKMDEHEIMVTPSIGISVFPNDGQETDELLRNADAAMYRAKESGGNQYRFYTNQLNKQSLVRLEMEADLRRAIINQEFFLQYQPQYNVSTKQLLSVEALIRWNHPKKGVVAPHNFIPLAEETGLIIPIGEWVLRTACHQNKEWQNLGYSPIRVTVNITTHQFKQPNIVKMIQTILQESGLEPHYLELELTENVIINSIESANIISELKAIGIQIALDDFGTGYSGLNYLRKIPIDRVKIDQSFIQNIDVNRGDEVIIQAIIAMAENLNLEILAEGVETKQQLDFLQSQNCREVQGFYFSKPLSADEVKDLLRP